MSRSQERFSFFCLIHLICGKIIYDKNRNSWASPFLNRDFTVKYYNVKSWLGYTYGGNS